MSLLKNTARRIIIALSGLQAGNNLIGAVGLYGGTQFGSAGAIANNSGDWNLVYQGTTGVYRAILSDSSLNPKVESIDWFQVTGFTPRNPTAAETAQCLVTGYNKDATTGQWYITIQIVTVDTTTLVAPPTGFVVGVRASVSFQPAANSI